VTEVRLRHTGVFLAWTAEAPRRLTSTVGGELLEKKVLSIRSADIAGQCWIREVADL